MLRTNSKKARENIRTYIFNHFDGECCDIETPANFKDLAKIILDIFEDEKPYNNEYMRARHLSRESVFIQWCQGLPSILDTCYYYNRPAVDDLGDILEETPAERAKFTESDAESLLTRLIYRELINA